jgi:hypothetical protein
MKEGRKITAEKLRKRTTQKGMKDVNKHTK